MAKNGEKIGETGGSVDCHSTLVAAPAAPNSKRVVQLLLPPLSLIAATHHTTTQAKLVLGLSGGTLDCPAISDEHIWGNFGSLGSRNNGPVHHIGHLLHSTFGVPFCTPGPNQFGTPDTPYMRTVHQIEWAYWQSIFNVPIWYTWVTHGSN